MSALACKHFENILVASQSNKGRNFKTCVDTLNIHTMHTSTNANKHNGTKTEKQKACSMQQELKLKLRKVDKDTMQIGNSKGDANGRTAESVLECPTIQVKQCMLA